LSIANGDDHFAEFKALQSPRDLVREYAFHLRVWSDVLRLRRFVRLVAVVAFV
jgi:hypothetical protein